MKNVLSLFILFVGGIIGGAAAQTMGGVSHLAALAAVVTPQFLSFNQSGSGTVSSGSGMLYNNFNYNQIWISNNVDSSSYGTSALNVELDTNGSSASGQQFAISSVCRVSAAKTPASISECLGIQTLGQVELNMGGTGTGLGQAAGAVFGAGINSIARPGATNLLNVTGMEIGISVDSGATTRSKSGISIATLYNRDLVQGAVYDGALSISAQSGSVGWKNGILFSDYNGQQPLYSGGTLIATQGSSTVTNGIDFSSYTFTGAPIRVPLMTPASSSDTCSAGAAKWDANYIYICTASNIWKRSALASF